MRQHGALIHEKRDDVAVAVVNIIKGDSVLVKTMDGKEVTSIIACEDVPLGHKLSVHIIEEGSQIVKYGYAIGVATQIIPAGAHVHIHNIKSLRWA